MCGIAGFRFDAGQGPEAAARIAGTLSEALRHRGPDGSGRWIGAGGRVGLVHTRLAIVDLTSTGAQPMVTADGRHRIIFNGEIYNHIELRSELEGRGHRFIGTSDTEVLLRLFLEEGEGCLLRLDGMFAFAVHDAVTDELFLARDPLGEKPLYYVDRPGVFAFASEVRALTAAGLASTSPDPEGIALFLAQGSIPAPWTHLRDVRFLQAGSSIRVPGRARVTPRTWWSLRMLPERDAVGDPIVALAKVEEAIRLSIRRRTRADVPLAAFLSGGIDSSLVASFLVEQGVRDLTTFTVTMPGHPRDESRAAAEIAAKLGTRHVEIPLDPTTSRDGWLDEALDSMDVPSVDGPNTWLVSREVATAGFKVAHSGLGGDELFFGYPSFRVVPAAWRILRSWSSSAKRGTVAGRLLQRLPPKPRYSRLVDAVLAGGGLPAVWFAKRGVLSSFEIREVLAPGFAAPGGFDPIATIASRSMPTALDPRRSVSFLETTVYMHDQLLRDTDVMSMAHGLEVRAPLIGLPVVEAVSGLSASVIAGDRPKHLLRALVESRLPREILDRPKQGFTLDWPAILAHRPIPSDDTLGGMLRPGSWERARRAVSEGKAGFAGLFVFEALAAVFRPR